MVRPVRIVLARAVTETAVKETAATARETKPRVEKAPSAETRPRADPGIAAGETAVTGRGRIKIARSWRTRRFPRVWNSICVTCRGR